MASGGRPPHSAPSLPLHSTPSVPLDSLKTPDTSSLFLSSLGNQAGSRTNTDFTSLEDLLNFTGISNHTPTPSLAALAQDLEQKQAMGPPPAKRIHCDNSTTNTKHLPSNIRVTSLSSTMATPSSSSSSIIPSLFPTTVVNATPVTQTTSVPQPQTTSVPLDKNHLLMSSNSKISSNLQATTATVVPNVLNKTSLSTSSATMATTSSTVSSTLSLPTLPSNPAHRALLVQLVQAYRQCTALADTQGQARIRTQLNLLLQAQQRMERTLNTPRSTPSYSITMTTSSLPNITTQHTTTMANHMKSSNILTSPSSSHSTPSHTTRSTPSLPTTTSKVSATSVSMATNTLFSQTFGSVSMLSDRSITTPTLTPLTTTHTLTPLTPLTTTHTLTPLTTTHTLTPLTTTHTLTPLTPLTTTPTLTPLTTTPTLTPLTTTPTRVPSSSGPASAIKAAALYNLRLRQLQLFLQSLPEEQRPHSIPELKALIQRSGGQLGSLAQTSVTPVSLLNTTSSVPPIHSSAAPVPTLLSTTTSKTGTVHTAPQPTVGQLMSSISSATLPSSTTSNTVSAASVYNNSLASGSMPLSPACLARFTDSNIKTQVTALPSTGDSVPSLTTAVQPLTVPSLTTAVQPLTVPSLTTAVQPLTVPSLTTAVQPLTTNLPISLTNKTIPSMAITTPTPIQSSSNEPIKPGVPTPLPPGVNPETLAVLCRMPDSDLEKLKLPVVLMSAIRVWRGQHQTTSGLQRGRKSTAKGLPIIIPPSQPPSTCSNSIQTYPSSLTAGQSQTQSFTQQQSTERDRLAALNKVLQSSEEARIAYRFNMLRDKMTDQLMSPDSHTPFKSLHDVIARLLPYHMWSEAEPPPGAIEKADAVYESVAHVLISRSQGLMSNYQHLIYHDSQRDDEAVMSVFIERLFQDSERERKEQEIQESQQAAQIAADLSMIAGAEHSPHTFNAEFALGDVMNSDPMLSFEPGIT